jgi:hypothetical protein
MHRASLESMDSSGGCMHGLCGSKINAPRAIIHRLVSKIVSYGRCTSTYF